MLDEAVRVIRRLLTGERVTHRGEHDRVEDAQLFTCPDDPPPIHVAAGGAAAAEVASRRGDGLLLGSPLDDVAAHFRANDDDRPVTGKLMTTWAADRDTARRTAWQWWPIGGVGPVGADLRLPSDFEAVAANCTEQAAFQGNVVTDDVAHELLDRFG